MMRFCENNILDTLLLILSRVFLFSPTQSCVTFLLPFRSEIVTSFWKISISIHCSIFNCYRAFITYAVVIYVLLHLTRTTSKRLYSTWKFTPKFYRAWHNYNSLNKRKTFTCLSLVWHSQTKVLYANTEVYLGMVLNCLTFFTDLGFGHFIGIYMTVELPCWWLCAVYSYSYLFLSTNRYWISISK